jgi:pyruvate/2-oxoglutarate dehydrogenase complex dihydrolipoamide acyltransferase (E2) component
LISFGIDLSWIGLPKYSFGAIIISNLENIGVDFAFLPIPSNTNSPLLLCIGKQKSKYHKESDKVIEDIYANFNITVDHRFFDGSYASKLNADFKNSLENLDDEYLFTDQLYESKKIK